MSYIPRLQCPESNNKYYNKKSTGGYSTCIQGNTSKSCYTSSLNVLPNCVGYALGRFNEIGNYKIFKYAISGNAEDWYSNAQKLGLKVGDTPKLGAIICWRKGKVENGSDGAGHVAIVEKINPNGSIVTSESGWSSSKLFWTTNRTKGSNGNWGQSTTYTFQGFIYNPATENINSETKDYLSRGDSGEKVKLLQQKLNDFGWYDLTLDGSFGAGTERALKDAQKKLKLTVDGIYGPETKTALEEAIKDLDNLTTIIVDKKERKIKAKNIDNKLYIDLQDIYYKLNLAEVSYNKTKKIFQIETK